MENAPKWMQVNLMKQQTYAEFIKLINAVNSNNLQFDFISANETNLDWFDGI